MKVLFLDCSWNVSFFFSLNIELRKEKTIIRIWENLTIILEKKQQLQQIYLFYFRP